MDKVEQDLKQLAADMLDLAKKQGADGAEVIIADGETFSVQVRLSAVERLTKAREKRLGLRVFIGNRSASVSTSDFSREALRRLVSDTCTLAAAVAEDEMSGLPPGDLMVGDLPDLAPMMRAILTSRWSTPRTPANTVMNVM